MGLRHITTHHDGHGLNECIGVVAGSDGPGGASRYYCATIADTDRHDGSRDLVLRVQFQEGPRNEPCSRPGVTEAVLLVILIDRLVGLQGGPYACQENEQQLYHLREALRLTKACADARAARGVLGTY